MTTNSEKKTLDLPAIQLEPIKNSLGYIQHVLRSESSEEIINIEQISISPRIKESLYHLTNNEKIIVTNRNNLERPDRVDGILKILEDGSLKWISHKILDGFLQRLKKIGLKALSKDIAKTWENNFNYHAEQKDSQGNIISKGLRPPQVGGLYSIGSHWSLDNSPATIVMPTGTGKTEVILATLAAYSPGKILIVVPSQILRDQTFRKFITFGLLRSLGNLKPEAQNPITGVIEKRPKSENDLKIFEECNVVITTISAIGQGSAKEFSKMIAKKIDLLIVDEAHHIGASSWSDFRENFKDEKILQFTATPYRRDGKLVDGKVIYEYPLSLAQKDGYFKKIFFEPIYEIDQEAADKEIASKAINKLKSDIASGKNHLLMARCSDINRAENIILIYKKIAPDLNPVIIHYDDPDREKSLEKLEKLHSRIAVCVNMLGEGYDLPKLKIAALHDIHKSLAVLLQFTGRFTRTADENIGDATVVANIADQKVSFALERLYSEDANWNQLLSEYSSDASKSHKELVDFLNTSKRLDESDENETIEISHHLLRPKLSTLTYEANRFRPKNFYKGLSKNMVIHRVWLHEESNTLYFVTRTEPSVDWTRSRDLKNRNWDLFILHYSSENNLLYLSSTDHSSDFEKMAKEVGATSKISGDIIFRSLGNINRLIFQNVGLRKYGRRNLSYALYTGADVKQALSISESGSGSVKSNLSGTGWEDGCYITIGCSQKGRIWTREPGTIPEFVNWCEKVGSKLKDSTIDTSQIIENVLIPEEVDHFPNSRPLSIEWPIELLRKSEEHIILIQGENKLPISLFDLKIINFDFKDNILDFHVTTEPNNEWVKLRLLLGVPAGFEVKRISNNPVSIKVGRFLMPIENFLSDYPPMIRFIDLSELDGNLLVKPKNTRDLEIDNERFEVWDWTGVDLSKESIWKNGAQRTDSIQWKASQHFIEGGFEIVIDDDGSGEAADLICINEEDEYIRLVLIHCKFADNSRASTRVKDVVEVCSQAVRSAKWKGEFYNLCRHIKAREKRVNNSVRGTRFLNGNITDLNKYIRLSRFKEIRPEIIIIQPGLSFENYSNEQKSVIASAYNYLKETIGVDLDIICSK